MARSGLTGAGAAQNIAHQTRRSKDQRDEESLKAEWRSRAQQYGIAFERRFVQRHRHVPPLEEKAREAIRQSIEENTEREAVIDRRGLEAKALQHAMGSVQLGQIRTESERFVRGGRLIAAGQSANSPQGTYTTPEMIALERENIAIMRAGQSKVRAVGSSSEIRLWASQRQLASDQALAADVILSSNDWITSIEGRAGAAKTTTVGAIREFAEQQGYAVYGFAPTTRAVKSLVEARMAATTLASLLESQSRRDAPKPKQIWIIDESSLLPTRQVNRLLHKASDEGVARLIFVGDQRQHHAIEAGRPIFQMQQAGMSVARLDTIRRQRDPELREAVERAAKGEISESLLILERRGHIREVADIKERRRQIARDYAVAHEAGKRVLVVSPANDERHELNTAIREELVARGQVAPARQEYTILVNRGLSGSRRAIAYNYEEGDVVRFTRGSRQFAVAKGDYARVEAVAREANLLTVKTAEGRRIAYNPLRLFGVEVFRQEQRILSRGDRIQFRAPDRALGVANGEFATIESINLRRAVMRLDSGRQLSAACDRLRHIDHGYASTSHSAQGATVDRVIVDIDTRLSPELVNRKQFYVSISRARDAPMIFTDDRAQLGRAVSRTREKSLALELERVAAPAYTIVPDEQRRTINRSYGMRR
jgi:ATP-dependent exoDNAse (exonuclease V) alpha subunit